MVEYSLDNSETMSTNGNRDLDSGGTTNTKASITQVRALTVLTSKGDISSFLNYRKKPVVRVEGIVLVTRGRKAEYNEMNKN